jgi:hypothetical protein
MSTAREDTTIPACNLLSQAKDGTPLLLNVSVIMLPTSSHPLATIHLFRDVTPQLAAVSG